MFKGNISFCERKKLLQKHELWMKGKFKLTRKEKFILWFFWIKEKVIFRVSGCKRKPFSTQETFQEFFRDGKYRDFLSQKVHGKMMFTDYWSSGFELFRDEKYGLFWAKKLMKRWYLLGRFQLSVMLQDLGNTAFWAVEILLTLLEIVVNVFSLWLRSSIPWARKYS